eukprot:COSAG02_NODE_22352_length_755_cov_1.051829_1_plen_216_part_01
MPTYQLRGVSVDFPYEAYPCQLDFMSSVIQALQTGQHALLESPTGTGKTLCLLCAALAWQHRTAQATVPPEGEAEGDAASNGQAAPRTRIVYASRTHSQLQQVIRELKLAVRHGSYDPAMCVLGSRDQMCVHPEVSEQRGVRQKAMCKSHVAGRTCNYREGVDAFIRRQQTSEIYDIEDLGELGRRDLVCPFYAVRELQANADIIFLPYNYLIDKS